MKASRLNQKGLSSIIILLGLVLALSSMAISLAARQSFDLQLLAQEVEKESIEDFLVKIRITLESKNTCIANIGGKTLPTSTSGVDVEISLPNPDRDGVVTLAKGDGFETHEGFVLSRVQLVKASNTKSKFGLYNLVIRGKTNRVPAKYINSTIPIYLGIDVTSGVINNCYSTIYIDDEATLSLEDKACNTRFNSTDNKYRFDVNTNTCVQELSPDLTGGMVL